MTKIDEILSSIDRLPPFPQVAQRAMAALNDPNSSARDLVKIIEYDQAITAGILRICNSAYFGLPTKIGSLQQAVAYIGSKTLMTIILASSALKYYSEKTYGYDLGRGELWRHSVACALLSQILNRKSGAGDVQELFTAGLLHDIGKLVMSVYVEREFKRIYGLVQGAGYSFAEAEREILGIDHAEMGGRIAELWNFPESISRCIALHHKPVEIPDTDTITPIIYLADMGCLFLGIGVGEDGLMYRCYPEVLKRCGFTQRDFEFALNELHDDLSKAEEVLRMV